MTSCWRASPIRRLGAQSAGEARRVHAAMSAWTSTNVIRGRRSNAAMAITAQHRERTGMSDDPMQTPRAVGGRAPDVFRPGGWIPMRTYDDDDEIDFAIVGTGA